MIELTQGIIFNSEDQGETSKNVFLITRDFGRLKLLVKGAKKSLKRFGYRLDHLNHLEFSTYKIRTESPFLLINCEIIHPFTAIKSSLQGIILGSFLVRYIWDLTYWDEPNEDLYYLVLRTLESIEIKGLPKEPLVFLWAFKLKSLELSGIKPWFEHCIQCEIKVNQPELFSFKSGGMICEDCMKLLDKDEKKGLIRMSVKTSNILLTLQEKGAWKNLAIKLNEKDKDNIDLFFSQFLKWHMDIYEQGKRNVNSANGHEFWSNYLKGRIEK